MSIDADNVVSNTSFLEKETDQENLDLDVLQTAETQLKYALEKNYTKDRLAKQIKFNAVCLYKLENKAQEHKDLVRVKARVPEIHSLLPKPTSGDDYATLALYPTYVGLKSSFNPVPGDSSDAIAPGTTLVVTYGNVSNFSDPLLLEVGKLVGAVAGSAGEWRIPDLGETRGSKTVRAISSSISPFKTQAAVFTLNKKRKLNDLFFLVIHDSDTSTRENMLKALNSRGALGTHFSVGGGAGIALYQYADLDRVAVHGGAVNKNSIGLDVINKPVWYNGSANDISKKRQAAIDALKSGTPPSGKDAIRNFLVPLADAMHLPTYLIKKYQAAGFDPRNYKKEPFYLDTVGNLIKGGTSKRLERIIDADTLEATYGAIKNIIFSDQLKAKKAASATLSKIQYNGQFVPGRKALKAETGTKGNIGFPSYDEKTREWSIGVSTTAEKLVSGKNSQGDAFAGIVAHGSYDDGRTDGRVAELYTFLRMRKVLSKNKAYMAVKVIYAAVGAKEKAKDLGIFDANYKFKGKYKNLSTLSAHTLVGSGPLKRPYPTDSQIQQLLDYHQMSSATTLYGLGAYVMSGKKQFKMVIT